MVITCELCIYFRPDRINPAAGLGTCTHPARDDAWFPNAPHFCRHREEKGDDTEEARTSE